MNFHPGGRLAKQRHRGRSVNPGTGMRTPGAKAKDAVGAGAAGGADAVGAGTTTVRSSPGLSQAPSIVRWIMTAAVSRVNPSETANAPQRIVSPVRLVERMNHAREPVRGQMSPAAKTGGDRWVRRDSTGAGTKTTGIGPKLTSMTSKTAAASATRATEPTTTAGHGSGAVAAAAAVGVAPVARAKPRPAAARAASLVRAMPTTNRSPRATAAAGRPGRSPPSGQTSLAAVQTTGRRPRAPEATVPAVPVADADGGAEKHEPVRRPSERAGRASVGNHPAPAAVSPGADVAANPAAPAAAVAATTSRRCRADSTRMMRDSNSSASKRPFARLRHAAVRPKTTMCWLKAG